MEILKSFIDQEVVVTQSEVSPVSNNEITGTLKEVDNDGVLILTGDEPNLELVYIKHFDYSQIKMVKKVQTTSSVFDAFKKREDLKWFK